MKALREFFEIVEEHSFFIFIAFVLLAPLCCGSGRDGCKLSVHIDDTKPTVDAGHGGSP